MIAANLRRTFAVLLCVSGTAGVACGQAMAQTVPAPIGERAAYARAPGQAIDRAAYARAPGQAIDRTYTDKIREFTTDPAFNSPLTDYLPASDTVPTPLDVLGHIAGAPRYLPYSADVYRYFRELAAASPRVRAFSIGRSEEGREMIAVAVADEELLADLDANKVRLARLGDPRRIGMDDAVAEQLIAQSTPVYYITGTIHSPETGSPTALMELAYRLAVDEAAYIEDIRTRVITLITPIVEVDGRDRMVDVYNWHLAHPGENYPPLLYWGHYVAHDNNRDAMTMTLNLTRNVADTFIGWHAQVLHDLHESVPFLYDNTVGDGPYNAWIDPILVGEWQQLGWNNVQQMTKLGMPGVFTHGDFDTWSPGYLMFIAATHNGISRLYETFGNGGADTVKRILEPEEYQRTWYKPNPPLPVVTWSQRNNNNYQQTGLLTALKYFADNNKLFLRNFYLKSKRSIEKPQHAGPAAYVLPAEEKRVGSQARLLEILQRQHVEISRTTEPVTVKLPPLPEDDDDDDCDEAGDTDDDRQADCDESGNDDESGSKVDESGNDDEDENGDKDDEPISKRFAAGSYVVRMDQPYSRIADTLLDHQYWAPDDPQKHAYDDTGWTMGELFNVEVVRVTDPAILEAEMELVETPVAVPEGLASVDAPAGRLPRIAVMHTWLRTQTEGWWRMALDKLDVPYDYISTQDAARTGNLRERYDVILFGPVGGDTSARRIIDGMPMWGNPMPWKTTELTPNIGRIDSTDDIRPGLGSEGVARLKQFVRDGGLLITAEDTAEFAIDIGIAPGVFVTPTEELRVVGSVLQAKFVDRESPIAAGYASDDLAVYSAEGMSFKISNLLRGDENLPNSDDFERATGRGGPHDTDLPEGRASVEPPELPDPEAWEALPLNVEQKRNNPWLIPADQRPRVILRFADTEDLLLSGLLDNGDEMAERAALVQARYGEGHVLLFATNPFWRGETIGSYALVLNAITHFDRLEAGARPTGD